MENPIPALEEKGIRRRFYLQITLCIVASGLIAFGIAQLSYWFVYDARTWKRVWKTSGDTMHELYLELDKELDKAEMGSRQVEKLQGKFEFEAQWAEAALNKILHARSRSRIIGILSFLGVLLVSFLCLYIYYSKIRELKEGNG